MILIADGGSTKVDWCLINKDGLVKQIFTKGANPFFRTTTEIAEELAIALVPQLAGYAINTIHFYGAGCAFPEKNAIIENALKKHFPNADITVGSDLLGAAIGLFANKAGIACIMGTGSNSCYYDGLKIVDNISPLGYVLGDEGSGAVLGRLFIGNCLKNQLTAGIKEKFFEFIGLSQAEMMDRIYKQPLPNRFLASVSPFINQNLSDKSVYHLVYNAFIDFFKKNVMQYDYRNNQVAITGSVAYYYKEVLLDVAKALDIKIHTINQSPMEGLVDYYKNLVK